MSIRVQAAHAAFLLTSIHILLAAGVGPGHSPPLMRKETLTVDAKAKLQQEVVKPLLQRLEPEVYDGSNFWRYKQVLKDAFTISLQFRTNSTAGSSGTWSFGVGLIDASTSATGGDFGLAMGDGKVMFGVESGGLHARGSRKPRTIVSHQNYADDRWHSIVANRDNGTGACSLWVDGVFQRTIMGATGPLLSSPSMDIGRISTGHGYFLGLLRNVEVYDQVLTPEELDELKELPSKMRRAKELVGVIEESAVLDFVGDTFKRYKRLVQDDFTISLQFKTSSLAGKEGHWWAGMGLVDAGVPGEADDFGVTMGQGRVMFGIGNPDTTIVSGIRSNDNRWHSVVASRTQASGAFKLWVDGVLEGEAMASRRSLNASQYLDMGRTLENAGYFQGYMKEVRIFDEVLAPADLGMEEVPVGTLRGQVLTKQMQETLGTEDNNSTDEADDNSTDEEDTQASLLESDMLPKPLVQVPSLQAEQDSVKAVLPSGVVQAAL